MDTKLKSIKYSVFTKFLCWFLSLMLFGFSFTIVTKIVVGSYIFGFNAFRKDEKVEFYSTEPFELQFEKDFFNSLKIATANKTDFYESVNKYREQTVDEVYNAFLERKAEIIGEELYYAVNNWGSEYYQYEDSVNDIEVQEETTSVEVTIPDESKPSFELPEDAGKYIAVPHYAPENIKVASYALNTANGTEFLKYEPLVRDGAFEGEFLIQKDVAGYNYSFGIYYSLSEEDAKTAISSAFDSNTDSIFENCYGQESLKYYLSTIKNLKYYIVNFDGVVVSNIDKIPSNLSNNSHYILANGANIRVVGFDDELFPENLKENQVKTLCLFFDEDFKEDDVYSKLYRMYNVAKNENMKMLCIELAAALLVALIFFVLWLRIVGKYSDDKKAKGCFINKIPNDIHFLLSIGIISGVSAGLVYLLSYVVSNEFIYSALLMDWEVLIPFSYFVIVFTVFTEWLSSVIRVKRAGYKYFKSTVIFKLLRLLKRLIIRLVNCFTYKPKAIKVRIAILFALYFLVNAVLVGIAILLFAGETVLFLVPCPLIIGFNITVCCILVEYVNALDKIIIASSEHEDIKLNMSTTPRSLKILADNLSYKNKSIDKAVAEAVKNEQMKTQLITNVSHDLKTPLTSLINYSDLLSKCELNNEDAEKYVEVINQKSDKLKHLIEDLIEASKASTGNIVLNRTKLNLSELSVQAIGEYMPDFEKSFIDVRFTEPTEAPIIFADGTKTYRIISNLLSNAKKYSAPDTRVYINVFTEGDFGCFEIKNISKEALDINPEQLTERFVRGDESRTNEGNGLGLAIAKDLCSLQNGVLNISIDGDLFKATVKLPLSK